MACNKALNKVHIYTFKLAREITGDGFITHRADHPFLGFRCYPQFRTPEGKKLRRAVFLKVIETRRAKNSLSLGKAAGASQPHTPPQPQAGIKTEQGK